MKVMFSRNVYGTVNNPRCHCNCVNAYATQHGKKSNRGWQN